MEDSEDFIEIEVKAAIAKLMEHCSSVQIFVTFHEDESQTDMYSNGNGSILMRYGFIKEWIVRHEEKMRIAARQSMEED